MLSGTPLVWRYTDNGLGDIFFIMMFLCSMSETHRCPFHNVSLDRHAVTQKQLYNKNSTGSCNRKFYFIDFILNTVINIVRISISKYFF